MIIGLMGGIGSGKSTILNYLQNEYKCQIIQSDLVAKELMQPGQKAFEMIKEAFPQVISGDNIDSLKLSQIVFSDKVSLAKLNSITHPATIEEISNRIKKSDAKNIVVESALLIGSGIENMCDEIWFVYCDMEERITRLIFNRGYTREKAIRIINNQPTDEEYNFYADEFIDNSFSENKTKEQIDIIMAKNICNNVNM